MKKSAQIILGLFVIFVTLLMLPFSIMAISQTYKMTATIPAVTPTFLNSRAKPSISTENITGNADCVYGGSTAQPAYAQIAMNPLFLSDALRIHVCVVPEGVSSSSLSSGCEELPVPMVWSPSPANATSYTIDEATYIDINGDVTTPFRTDSTPRMTSTISSDGKLSSSIIFNAGDENTNTNYPIPWSSNKAGCSDPYYTYSATYDFVANLCKKPLMFFVPGSGSCTNNTCTFECTIST